MCLCTFVCVHLSVCMCLCVIRNYVCFCVYVCVCLNDSMSFTLSSFTLLYCTSIENSIKVLCTDNCAYRYDLFLPHSDAAKLSMQERLRYNDTQLQKGLY